MVAAMTRHLHSLRRLKRDFGWIHTLLGNDTFHYTIQFILNCYIIYRQILHKQSIFVLIKRMLLKYQKKQSNYLKCLIVITSMTTNFEFNIYIQRQNGECRSASSVEVTRIDRGRSIIRITVEENNFKEIPYILGKSLTN